MLEEQIAILQHRVQELESHSQKPNPVLLNDPYSHCQLPRLSTTSSPTARRPELRIRKVCHVHAIPPSVPLTFMHAHAFLDVLGSPGNIHTPNRMPRLQAEAMDTRGG